MQTRNRLPMVQLNPYSADLDVEAELARFESEERARLGLEERSGPQWKDRMTGLEVKASERPHTTLLISGLTMAHDSFMEAALRGAGYRVRHLDCPDNEALQFGKEYGNRAQCNPTYYTVGNLVKHLVKLRQQGESTEDIIKNYVFLTAGTCGPCRFGMYVTEYRKALRDAGFDGFRVLLFQEVGGVAQATGDESAIQTGPAFFISLSAALLAGDVINALAYRIRPYEIEPGATDRALASAKRHICEALAHPFDGHLRGLSRIFRALYRTRKEFGAVKVDRFQPKPKVSIIGEFWAMTTEGDGNYQLQRFLENEGAECDIQVVTAWMLYIIWKTRYDTNLRAGLRRVEGGRRGLEGVNVARRVLGLVVADKVLRAVFRAFAAAVGLHDFHLPNMDEVERVSRRHYNPQLRGGEGHMEVGKLMLNVLHQKSHMTVSVKPFGCMPSSGVSDGVQSAVTERLPQAIFCAVETSGDGRVSFYSRVQMFLFKAKLAAKEEFDRTLQRYGLTEETVREWLGRHPRYLSSLHRPRHRVAGSGADLIHEVAPFIVLRPWQRLWSRARGAARSIRKAALTAYRLALEVGGLASSPAAGGGEAAGSEQA